MTKFTFRFVPAIMVAVVAGLADARAQKATQTSAKIEVSKLGPQVGQTVPDFSLTDQNGKVWTRQSIMGPKGAMLLFYRSADWCPYCKTQLVDLQSRIEAMRAKGLGVAAISYDPVPVLAAFATQHHITFPLLSDAGSATIKAFGILNTAATAALGPDKDNPDIAAAARIYVSAVGVRANMEGIPFPGTFVLDPKGHVVSRAFEDAYRERSTFSSILLRAGDGLVPVAATKVATNHLEATVFSSDATIAPGNVFTLAVSVAPHPNVHVYAPGAQGYRPIALTLNPQPFVRLSAVQYPKSDIYFFAPLKERVPVFQKPFTLTADVVFEGSSEAQAAFRGKTALTIEGELAYQACDDKVCFTPTAVPVAWTIGIGALVAGR